jgi:hypothetical protein
MIANLGNYGDRDQYNNSILGYDGKIISDLNNGIDAVADDNWIRVMWYPLIHDNDLDYLKIYRFPSESIVMEDLFCVDSISLNNNFDNFYIDKTLTEIDESVTDKSWSYFIELFDSFGNCSFSDTVSYKLLKKPILIEPQNNSHLLQSDSLIFRWNPILDTSLYRLIIFDEHLNLVWMSDFLHSFEEIPCVNYSQVENVLPVGAYYYRVDVLSEDNCGAESVLFKFVIY